MSSEAKKVRTRFAPSPTGYVHIGNLRTALYSYLIAKRYGGDFILRVEDTDQKRFIEGALEAILGALNWAGITIDEGVYLDKNGKVSQKGNKGPYVQSERLEIYRKYADELVEKGLAYPCFCSSKRLEEVRATQQKQGCAPMYDKHCAVLDVVAAKERMQSGEPYVIRMRVPKGEIIEIEDLVYGKIKVPSDTVDDQVIIKSDGYPTYHLAVVVDDHLMDISHIVRGEDWMPSTPKHVLLYRYFGWEMPKFLHAPNILNENRKKLSKRQGDVSVEDFIKKGYLPEALVNFIALLGWNPKTEQEFFTIEELARIFDEKHINKAGAIFDYKKLDWMNAHYIKSVSVDKLTDMCLPYFQEYFNNKEIEFDFEQNRSIIEKIVSIEKERIKKLSEITENVDFYFSSPECDIELLHWKDMTNQEITSSLSRAKEVIGSVEDFSSLEEIKEKLMTAAGEDRGRFLWPLRVSLSGKKQSPGPFEISWVIGREEAVRRIERAINRLESK